MLRSGLFGALALAMVAGGAQAQNFSKGYKFLESVRNNEMSDVNNTLSEPGNQIINTHDISTGDTALHILAARRDTPWINYFLARGADPNAKNNKGETPLVTAANIGYNEGVELLLNSGARPDESNATGETPLMSAVHRRDVGMVRLLLKAGANPDRSDSAGRTARDYAKLEDRSGNLTNEIDANAKKQAGSGRSSYGPSLP
ncbi:ankyrin repeat domain-containing protein [Novosphingobium terrae]|uniref:ankyrin repeat domain-containing protein n=1 Tax=Novosphingobium terrae TaxID=2726189 RepID=UPI00197F11BA|nr:ankyrin repeat domain-containing protein [Novosphingobium terrae]